MSKPTSAFFVSDGIVLRQCLPTDRGGDDHITDDGQTVSRFSDANRACMQLALGK